jgi:hypothetical protein
MITDPQRFVRLRPERVDKLVLGAFGLYTPGHVRLAKLFFKLPYGLLLAYYRRAMKCLLAGGSDDLLTAGFHRATIMATCK